MKEKKLAWVLGLGLGLLASNAILAACSDSTTNTTPTADAGTDAVVDAGGGDTATAPPALRGTISYSGSKTGPAVYVAAFANFPPMGPPDGLVRVANPAFPQTYSISKLGAGVYTITAFLSVGSDHPGPGAPFASDPQSVPTQVTIVAGGTVTTDLTLIDMTATDAGSDATDAGADAPDDGATDAGDAG